MYSFLVLLGCFNSMGKGDTFGTGILIEYNGKLFIASCKHVYNEIHNKRNIFAIPKPKQTLSPQGGYKVLQLGKHNFHPIENCNTYDIVVFEVINVDLQSILTYGIEPLKISNCTKCTLEYNQEVYAIGFPIDYVKNYLANEKEELLPPKEIIGYLKDFPIDSLRQIGFAGKLIEGFILELSDENFLGKGNSGGLVFTKIGSDFIIPLGLILGSGKIYINNIDELNVIVFAKIDRIIETLDSI